MTKTLHWFITFTLAGFTIYMLYTLHHTQLKFNEIKEKEKAYPQIISGQTDLELVHYMQRIQIFHLKLFFAGVANNKELVKFYLHEIEEEMETIADAQIIDDEINISRMMRQIGLPAIKNFEDEYKKNPENFETIFSALTQACNTCHATANYPQIIIVKPEFNPFTNQQFIPR